MSTGDKLKLLSLVGVLYAATAFGRLTGQLTLAQLLTLLLAELTLSITIIRIPTKDDNDKGDYK